MDVIIDANLDTITCPGCRICVPQGMVCGCKMRTLGPVVENSVVRMIKKENNAS